MSGTVPLMPSYQVKHSSDLGGRGRRVSTICLSLLHTHTNTNTFTHARRLTLILSLKHKLFFPLSHIHIFTLSF